jgi:hypothetical protein
MPLVVWFQLMRGKCNWPLNSQDGDSQMPTAAHDLCGFGAAGRSSDAAQLPGGHLSSLPGGLESDTLKPPPWKLEAFPGIDERSYYHPLRG